MCFFSFLNEQTVKSGDYRMTFCYPGMSMTLRIWHGYSKFEFRVIFYFWLLKFSVTSMLVDYQKTSMLVS